jgi:hypothetical protein
MKKLRNLVIFAVIAGLGTIVAYQRYFWTGLRRITRTVDAPAVLQQIQSLQELATVKYTLQKVIGLEEEKIPFGSESVMMVVLARVKAGVDLSMVTLRDVGLGPDKQIVLRLPAPKILDIYIDDKETKVYQRTKTWWTPWVPNNPALEQQARQAALESVQLAATQSGILSNAQQNAETALRAFLQSAGFQTVSFISRP